MTRPEDIIYNITLEQFNGPRPIHLFLQFDEFLNCEIIGAQDPITNHNFEIRNINALIADISGMGDRVLEAIKLLKWAVLNDPDPQPPGIIDFIKTI
jgi:hypothetical protein